MTENKTILISGGAGYIGSVLTGKLLTQGYNVRVLDSLLFGGRGIASYKNHPNFHFIHGDIGSISDLNQATKQCDSAIHLAAIVGDPACAQNPALARKVNKESAELFCKVAIENKVRKFIFASTCSNYGKMADPDGFVDETSALNPISLYAELKVSFEQFLISSAQTDFTPVSLRFATAYGLSPRPRFDLTVNEFTLELLMNRKLDIYGEQFWRPYCHTQDLAAACIKAVEADESILSGEAFNVGCNSENYQKKTLADMILEQLPDKKKNVKYVQRLEDPRDYRVNFDKIKNRLKFKISMRVPDGIKEIITNINSGVITDPDNIQYKNFYKE